MKKLEQYDIDVVLCDVKLPPGYRMVLERSLRGIERLTFTPIPVDSVAAALRRRALATALGEKL